MAATTQHGDVWRNTGSVWSRASNRHIKANYWCCNVEGRVYEGFGTKREATAYVAKHEET